MTLEFYTRTLNDARYTGTLCVYLFKRHETGSPPIADRHDADERKSAAAAYWTYTPQGNRVWPRTEWTKVRLTMAFNGAPYTIPAGDRLGVALSVERSNTAGRRDPDHVRPPELPDPDRGRHQHADRRGLAVGRRRGARLPRRADRRQLRHRGRPPGAARRIDRRPALALSRLRRADRRLRQRPGPLLGAAARACALLRGADLGALPADRAGLGAALRGDRARPLGRRRRDRARPGLRDDAGGGHADRPRAADHPQQDPRSSPRSLGVAIAAARDPGSLPERAIAAAAARRPALRSPRSPTRAGWGWATSSWRR